MCFYSIKAQWLFFLSQNKLKNILININIVKGQKQQMQPTSVGEYMDKLFKQISRNDLLQLSKKKLRVVKQDTERAIFYKMISMPEQLGVKQLKLKRKNCASEHHGQEEAQFLKIVHSEKQITKQKLKELQTKQLELKHKIRQFSPKLSQKPMSVITYEQKKKIKKILHDKRSFENQLDKKDKQISEQKEKRRQQTLKEKQEMIQKRREKKKQEAMKKLQSIELRSLERKKIQDISRELQKNIQEKRYLYQEYQQNDLDLSEEKQGKKEEILNQIHKRYKLDLQQIRQHSRKYDKLIRQNRRKSHSKSSMSVNREMKSYADNRFSVMVKQRLQAEKLQEYQRLNFGHELKNKIAKYQKRIDDSFKPKVSKKSRFVLPEQQVSSVKSLSGVARYMKGMEYLQAAKKLKSFQRQKQRKLLQASNQNKPYRNYLEEIEKKKYETDEQKFKQIVKRGCSMGDYESANTAILLAEKIEAKIKKTGDQKVYHSVKNKIDILKALE